jgi:hypothetical protein
MSNPKEDPRLLRISVGIEDIEVSRRRLYLIKKLTNRVGSGSESGLQGSPQEPY